MQNGKDGVAERGWGGSERTHLFEDMYLIFYGPAVVPNVRSLVHGGQQIRSCQSSKAATNDSNFDASGMWI